MKRLLIALLLLSGSAFGQGVRYGDEGPVIQAKTIIGYSNQFLTIPHILGVNWCGYPANGSPCTNKATTYTDATLSVPCSTSTQLVLADTTSCVGVPDQFANWGIWAPPGRYTYTIQTAEGYFGPYTVILSSGTLVPLCTTNKAVLFDDAGIFGCDAKFTWDKAISQLAVNALTVNSAGQAIGPAFISNTVFPADAGVFRAANDEAIEWRNAGNTTNAQISLDTNDLISLTAGSGQGSLKIDTAKSGGFGQSTLTSGVASIAIGSTSASPGIGNKTLTLDPVGGGTLTTVFDHLGYISTYAGAAAPDDGIFLGDGTEFKTTTIPDCTTSTDALYYTDSTNTIGCHAITSTGASCDITATTTWHVSTAGNDTTGDGSVGLPWLTIQHAIDAGIPGLVCGQYIIQLDEAADRSAQTAILNGRAFAGGSGGGSNDSSLGEWPISDSSTPPAYSWVEINGDPDVTSTYIIGSVSVAGGNLILRGVKVSGAGSGVGVLVAQGFASFDGTMITGFTANLLCTEGSVCHVDGFDFVDQATCVTCLNLDLGTAGFDNVEMSDDSLFTDYLSDGNNTNSNVIIGTTATSGYCLETKYSRVYLRGTLNCTLGGTTRRGISALGSRLSIHKMTINGGSFATTTGVHLEASTLTSPEGTGQGDYTLENLAIGVLMDGPSALDTIPSFSGNTADWAFSIPGNSYASTVVNGRSADYVQTVTFSATPAFDMNKGAVKKITLTGDVTSSTITNPTTTLGVGEYLTFIICQDGGGAHTFAWATTVTGADTIGSTASKCNVQKFVYDQAATKWRAIGPMVKDQ